MNEDWSCADVLDLVEPVASGDLPVSDSLRSHLQTCPRCAAALASARRLEGALAALGVPAAPQGFTAAVIARVRRERWRSEQRIDRIFNVAIAAALLLVAGGIAALLNVGEVLAAAAAAWTLLSDLTRERQAAAGPSLVTYAAAAAFMASALAMWWWAERRLSL